MLKTNTISLAAALALAGSLTLVGCGSSSTETVSSNSEETQTVNKTQTGSISGSVKLVNNPTDRTIRTDATTQIVAYNLDDNTQYTTTSTSQGEYDLSGLTEGSYQVIATSTSTTMRSIRQATVVRDTRAVVDIVLQATGTIKGTIVNSYEYTLVSIPGTSYISTVDKSGNFELINVPSGEVTISLLGSNGYYSQNVTVVGGGETIVENLGISGTVNSDVGYVYGLGTDSTLEMRHEGIRLNMNKSYTLAEFKDLVSFVDSNNSTMAVEVDYEYYYENEESRYFKIRTTSVVDSGTYTLKLATSDAYEKEIVLQDKVAVFSDSYTNNGVYQKSVGMAFSNPVADLNSSSVTVTYLNDANATQILPVTGIEQVQDEDNSYKILANFASNVKYEVTLDSAVAEDGIFYPDDGSWDSDGVTIGDTSVGYISIDENEEGVSLDKDVRFTINSSDSLDLQTLKVTLGDKELTIQNGGLTSNNNYYYGGDYLDIQVSNGSLSYNKDLTMLITANDSYGDKVLDRSVSFKTISPATVGILPFVDPNNDEDDEWLYNLSNSYNGVLSAYFNVPVAYATGSISLHDNTNNKDVNVMTEGSYINQTYANNTITPYYVGGFPSELLPNTEYTMTVSGFTATDGTEIATKTNTFKTPGRAMLTHSVNNGQLIDTSYLNNRIEFATFGKLSDAEKSSLVNGLDVTSFNAAMATDKTHPELLALWDDNSPYGSKLILAFTIEKGTSYELAFSGDVAKEFDMTASPLTFMTMGAQAAVVPVGFNPAYNVVNTLYTYSNSQDYNLSNVSQTVDGYASVTIPYIIDESYNSTSYTQCNDLKYKNIYNYSGYENAPDVNSSLISEWMEGSELNTTSTSLSGMYYNSHYYYDENNNYNSYYACDITYNANFSISNEVNSSVSVNVPENALVQSELVAGGFTAMDTNRTYSIQEASGAYANMSIYGNSIIIQFSKPVLLSSLDNIVLETTPNLNVQMNEPYAPYYDENNNTYVTSVSGTIDSSAYSVFQYDVNSTVTYFDVRTQTSKDLNVTQSGIVYTTADLTPLEVSNVSTLNGTITLDVNRAVNLDSVLTLEDNGTVISSAFTLSNDNNESNVTATITKALNTYNYSTNSATLALDVSRSDSASECYDAMNFTLTQDELIKASNSLQTLDAGSVTATIVLPEETLGCVVDTNTTLPTDTNTTY